MLTSFYEVATGLSFTLLGLWWVVVQFKYQEWMLDRAHRRLAFDTSLYFLLPGIMSLVSLLSERVTVLWRVGFGLAGAIGVVEALAATAAAGSTGHRVGRMIRWTAMPLFALVVVFAVAPGLGKAVGLTGIEVEALILSLLLFAGANFAWFMFAAGARDEARAEADLPHEDQPAALP